MFHFDKEYNEFTQEISTLGNCLAALTGRLYDDACDEGFVLVSHHTGQELPFYLVDVEKSDEGEIQCWNFKSTSPHKLLENMTVTVFND